MIRVEYDSKADAMYIGLEKPNTKLAKSLRKTLS